MPTSPRARFDLTRGLPPNTALSIVVGADAGTLEATVTDEQPSPVEDAQVVLFAQATMPGLFTATLPPATAATRSFAAFRPAIISYSPSIRSTSTRWSTTPISSDLIGPPVRV